MDTTVADGLLAVASGSRTLLESSSESESESSWVFPLLLSCLAGASTCVGAAVVFCFEPSVIRRSMAFSLSLAAAVMITISVVSILPEVATGILTTLSAADSDSDSDGEGNYDFVLPGYLSSSSTTMTIVRTRLLLERLVSFGVGVSAYLMLTKLLVFLPDPEHMYLLDDPGDDDDDDYKKDYDLYLSPEHPHPAGVGGNRGKSVEDGMERGLDTSPNSNSNSMTMPMPMIMPVSTASASASAAPPLIRRRVKNPSAPSSHESLSSVGTAASSTSIAVVHGDGNAHAEDNDATMAAFAKERRKRSWRVALMLFASLLIHNFPEGLCVAASAKESPELGITVAIGIFIHNVPEGIAISVPCIAARPDRPWLAFWLASFSGLAEPLGAAVALTMLGRTKLDLENILAFVAGVMITVSFWELYPEAFQANDEELQANARTVTSMARNSTSGKRGGPPEGYKHIPWTTLLLRTVLRPEYRSILWGTVVGTGLMVATELYLP